MDVGELIEQLHHSVVVFEGVQTHPGETVLCGDQIFVERLMLVPKQNDTQNRHRWLNPDYNGIFSSLAWECSSTELSACTRWLEFMQLQRSIVILSAESNFTQP